jgi:hypothetical protein
MFVCSLMLDVGDGKSRLQSILSEGKRRFSVKPNHRQLTSSKKVVSYVLATDIQHFRHHPIFYHAEILHEHNIATPHLKTDSVNVA